MNTTERRKINTPEQREAERLYGIRYRQENRERQAKYAAERRAAGKVKGTTYYRQRRTPEQRAAELAYKQKHYQETREQQLAYAAKYREENYERLKAEWQGQYGRRKDWYDRYNRENYDRIRARRLAWSAANSERIKHLNAEWSKNNLHRHRGYQHKRRSRIAQCGGALSTNIIELLLVRQKGRCACCGQRLRGSYHLDHIVPLALGGPNTDNNVQLLTPRCNWQKGAKHPIEFMQQRRGMLL